MMRKNDQQGHKRLLTYCRANNTCPTVHIRTEYLEMLNDMSNYVFINSLRCFIAMKEVEVVKMENRECKEKVNPLFTRTTAAFVSRKVSICWPACCLTFCHALAHLNRHYFDDKSSIDNNYK